MAMAIYTRLRTLTRHRAMSHATLEPLLNTMANMKKANANSLSTAQFGLLNTIMSHLTISPEEATTNSDSRSPTMKPPS